jgi:hypothetical protein
MAFVRRSLLVWDLELCQSANALLVQRSIHSSLSYRTLATTNTKTRYSGPPLGEERSQGTLILRAIALVQYADHLNTPRLVADATGTTVWRWDQQDPFGNNPAACSPRLLMLAQPEMVQ